MLKRHASKLRLKIIELDLTTAPPWARAMQRLLTDEIRGLKADIAGVRTEIAGLKTGISAGIDNRLTELVATISGVERSVADLSLKTAGLNNKLDAVQVDVGQASAIKGPPLH